MDKDDRVMVIEEHRKSWNGCKKTIAGTDISWFEPDYTKIEFKDGFKKYPKEE